MRDSDSQEWFGQTQASLVEALRKLADDLDRVGQRQWPPDQMVDISEYFLGRRAVPCLIGRASGHPSIRDGNPMFTSELFYMDVKRGYARSFSRWYRLGLPAASSTGHSTIESQE
jgi:hypothetical protein